MMFTMDNNGLQFRSPAATLTNLADALSRFTERPVIDMTDIKGQYDFDMTFAPETARFGPRVMGPGPGPGGDRAGSDAPAEQAPSIFEALQKYGLKLDPRKAPMEVIVVDYIEKTPTEN